MQNKLKCLLTPTTHPNCTSAALFFLRVVVGIAFMYHGWGKIQSPFGWMGPDAPVPGILQMLAAVAEFGGGMALIIGLLTKVASIGLACTMLVATIMHAFVMKDPFVASAPGSPSYELALVYLAISVLLMATGPGKHSIDAKFFKA